MDLLIFLVLMGLGYGFGRLAEKRHYTDIIKREGKYQKLLLVASRQPPPDMQSYGTSLVSGNVVISVDYFKRFLSSLRRLVGGRMKSYETLLDRARREAVLRMKEHALKMKASMIFNPKFETSSIYKGRKNSVGSVEVLVYGTAFIPPKDDSKRIAHTSEVTKNITSRTAERVYGKIIVTHVPGQHKDAVCRYVAKLSNTSGERIASLLSKSPVVLIKNVEKMQGLKIISQLEKAGVVVGFQPHPPNRS